MNCEELLRALQDAGVPGRKYVVNGCSPVAWMDEGRVFLQQEPDGRWSTFGVERGNRTFVRYFDDEAEACQSFYDSLTRTVPPPVDLASEKGKELMALVRQRDAERKREREEYFRQRGKDQAGA